MPQASPPLVAPRVSAQIPEMMTLRTPKPSVASLDRPGRTVQRSVATLVRSWAYLASGSPAAELRETQHAAIAIFVHPPDRQFLNNALLSREIRDRGPRAGDGGGRARLRRARNRAVRGLGPRVRRCCRGKVRSRGYRHDTSTRAMSMPIGELAEFDISKLDVVEPSLEDFWAVDGIDDLLPELDPEQAHFYIARRDGKGALTLMAFDHAGDCSIGMVETVPAARRMGLATKLCAHAVADAMDRGWHDRQPAGDPDGRASLREDRLPRPRPI